MDTSTLSQLHDIFQEVQQKQDWKVALDTLFISLRGSFVFDNVAIYLKDPRTEGMDVAYARAMGRGKNADPFAINACQKPEEISISRFDLECLNMTKMVKRNAVFYR